MVVPNIKCVTERCKVIKNIIIENRIQLVCGLILCVKKLRKLIENRLNNWLTISNESLIKVVQFYFIFVLINNIIYFLIIFIYINELKNYRKQYFIENSNISWKI